MAENRQSIVRTAVGWGRERLNTLGKFVLGMFVFMSRVLGIALGLLVPVSLVGIIGVVLYLIIKHW